jgi:hypothetical protein
MVLSEDFATLFWMAGMTPSVVAAITPPVMPRITTPVMIEPRSTPPRSFFSASNIFTSFPNMVQVYCSSIIISSKTIQKGETVIWN